ncbi:MAG: GDSL-type esterase/lipase family protein [Acidobacteria bacterium]|nr:GDSL-type esterase/lipase family protein [Acidobacteriota bacterium]
MALASASVAYAGIDRRDGQEPDPSPAPVRRLVITGSSTASGAGASRYATSWAGLLTTQLEKRGWEVINVSIGGENVAAILARFDRDVAVHSPGVVLLANSILNDGFDGNPPATIAQRYLDNVAIFAARVRALGAVPMVLGQNPNDYWDKPRYELLMQIYRELENRKLLFGDLFSGLSKQDGTGNWVTPLRHQDGVHPNDLGHRLMFDALPHSMLDVVLEDGRVSSATNLAGSWAVTADQSPNDPLVKLQMERPVSSWSACVWVNSPELRETAVLISDDRQHVVLRQNATGFALSAGALLAEFTPRDAPDGKWRHVCVIYQEPQKRLELFINGDRATGLAASIPSLTGFWVGGFPGGVDSLPAGTSLGQLLIYRTSLQAFMVRAAMAGDPPQRSLEVWLPLTGTPQARVPNVAPTRTGASALRGSFRWVENSPPSGDSGAGLPK